MVIIHKEHRKEIKSVKESVLAIKISLDLYETFLVLLLVVLKI